MPTKHLSSLLAHRIFLSATLRIHTSKTAEILYVYFDIHSPATGNCDWLARTLKLMVELGIRLRGAMAARQTSNLKVPGSNPGIDSFFRLTRSAPLGISMNKLSSRDGARK